MAKAQSLKPPSVQVIIAGNPASRLLRFMAFSLDATSHIDHPSGVDRRPFVRSARPGGFA